MTDVKTTAADLSEEEKAQPNVKIIVDPRPVFVDGQIVGMASLAKEEQANYKTGEKTGEVFVQATFQPIGRGRQQKMRWKHATSMVDALRAGLDEIERAAKEAAAKQAQEEAEKAAADAQAAAAAAQEQAEKAAAAAAPTDDKKAKKS